MTEYVVSKYYFECIRFHLRYYYIFGEAIGKVLKGEMSWEEAIKENPLIRFPIMTKSIVYMKELYKKEKT